MSLARLIEASYSPVEAAALAACAFDERAREAVGQAAKELLTDYLPVPAACALMSALFAEMIKARIDHPIHVVAGTLDADGVRVFGRTALAVTSTPFLRSDLDWDGHMWVMVGDHIADISLLRTASFPKAPPALKRLAIREFGRFTGLMAWTAADALESGLRYGPSYVLTLPKIDGLAQGARATLPRA